MNQIEQYFIGNSNFYLYYVIEEENSNKGKLCFSKKPFLTNGKNTKFNIDNFLESTFDEDYDRYNNDSLLINNLNIILQTPTRINFDTIKDRELGTIKELLSKFYFGSELEIYTKKYHYIINCTGGRNGEPTVVKIYKSENTKSLNLIKSIPDIVYREGTHLKNSLVICFKVNYDAPARYSSSLGSPKMDNAHEYEFYYNNELVNENYLNNCIIYDIEYLNTNNVSNIYKFNLKIDRRIKYPNLYYKYDKIIKTDWFYTFNFEFFDYKTQQNFIIYPEFNEDGTIDLCYKKEPFNIYPEDIYDKLGDISKYKGISKYLDNEILNPNYSALYDINKDDIIDYKDIELSEKTHNKKFYWILKDIDIDEEYYPKNKDDYVQILETISSIKFKNIILLDRDTDRNYSLNIKDTELTLGDIKNLNLILTHTVTKINTNSDDETLIESIYSTDDENRRNTIFKEIYNESSESPELIGWEITTNIHYNSVDIEEDEENNIIYINIV